MKLIKSKKIKICFILIMIVIFSFNTIASFASVESESNTAMGGVGSILRQVWIGLETIFENSDNDEEQASVMYKFWGGDEDSSASIGNGGYGISASGSIVENAKRIHQYIKENQYAYSCTHNVSNGYTNTCECDGTSVFGKSLDDKTVSTFYKDIRCIDCSAFVSWVLFESGIKVGRQSSSFFYGGDYNKYDQYKWEKITDWNALEPGDILVKSGHVEIYAGEGHSFNAGSTNGIRADFTSRGIAGISNTFSFALRVSK